MIYNYKTENLLQSENPKAVAGKFHDQGDAIWIVIREQ
jgi:hypothetical protein